MIGHLTPLTNISSDKALIQNGIRIIKEIPNNFIIQSPSRIGVIMGINLKRSNFKSIIDSLLTHTRVIHKLYLTRGSFTPSKNANTNTNQI